jgi:pyrimidine deaminase RibD-like protein
MLKTCLCPATLAYNWYVSKNTVDELKEAFEKAKKEYDFWTSGGNCEPGSPRWGQVVAKYNAARDAYDFALREQRAEPDDRKFALLAIEEARKSIPEDERIHPKVGAVIVKGGKIVGEAHRGENPKSHAEYIALEGKLSDDLVAGATVYTTLEPCTTRTDPKIPCAQRLVERKVARVVIGMLDPNPEIRGLGEQLLSEAGIETQLFPKDLRAQVEEMNREFIRVHKQKQTANLPRKGNERLPALEELAGQLVEELASYRPLDPSKVAPMLEEFRQAAGRFARYDHVRRAILQLQNTLERMFATKRDHTDDEQELRSELDRDLKQLLSACDQISERDKLHHGRG